ncbi:MAG: hypothetical protein HY016_13410 [Nitrosomonadales bacterium]|nr:hypothetical protein [Nitrosomonadales bacterium]
MQSFELKKQGITPAVAITKVTGVLVDRGFDVKMSNVESGIVTTEYKKFASVNSNPPFDYYMQIRGKVKVVNGVTSVQLTPVVKEQNRMNVAAFNEQELGYYTGEPDKMQYVNNINSMRAQTGYRALGQVLFMNVVTESADALGISADEVIQNVSKSPADAIGAN